MTKSNLVVQTTSPQSLRGNLGDALSSTQVFLGRMMWGMLSGFGFGGARDYYQVFGWNRNPQHRDFVMKYIKQDITQRVINQPVKSQWTDHPHLNGGTRFNSAWEALVKDARVKLYHNIARADIFAGLGAYAVMMIGFDDGRSPDQPVNTSRKNKVTFLQPYLQGSVEIKTIDADPASPRFGLPVLYKLTPGNSLVKNSTTLAGNTPTSFMVHYSRVLHLADNCLENTFIGHSRLESIYNILDDLLKVTGGSAETYWLTANRGMQVDVDKEMELDPEDAKNLADEVEEYEHGLRRVMRTRGVKVTNLGSDMADPRGVFNVLVALLASNTGIPQRVLIGAEAGQLASQQDRANWAVQVGERTSNWGEPLVLLPFVGTLVAANALPEPKDLTIEWPEPFKMNPFERGQTSAQQARSATNVARAMQTAQAIGVEEMFSAEEAREMVAPGNTLLILKETPVGKTFPPKLKAPVQDPQNKLDEIEAQTEADIKKAKEAPPPAPFGGAPNPADEAPPNA